MLDELYDAIPVPRLPAIVASSAGRGELVHWAAQSVAHLEELYQQAGRRQLLDNTITLTIFVGMKDQRTPE
ncbi:TraM recognition domain-containing protein [Saccharopolyspora sp. 5N708]|uniref:TraM recognition domain-containing protein n=1 Tax=Saccharopolyspora sp. 5N708 TaxID=3457424 RepID=UPI003FD51AC0